MKKVFKSLFVIVAAMITFAGCAKQEIDAPATSETKTVQFFAESIETKTAFGTPDGTTYPTLWTANDQTVKLLLNLNEEFSADVAVADDFKTASFNAEVTVNNSEAPYTFYAMSPASAYLGKTADRYSATIPTTQKPLENSVDEAAQILYAVSEEFNEIPNTVSLNFKHFTAYGKLSFVNLELGDAKVTSIAISSTDVKLAGRWNYVVADGSFTENSGATEITLDTDKTENLWFACAPVGSMDGKKLKFTVNTDKGPLSKEVTLSGDKYNFEAGHIAKMNVDMQGITFAESKVYELVTDADALTVDSKIIIVAKDYDYALSTTQNGNNRGQAAVTKVDNKIENPGDGVQVLTVGEGYAEGTLSFSTGQQYLYAPGGGNYLRSTTTLNDNASWTVTIADGVATIKANRSGKNWMRYNSTNSIFSCYDSGQKDIVIYKLQGSGTVKENYLEVSTNAIEVEADATTASFTVSSDLEWTVSSEDAIVTTDGNTVNVSFAANEETVEKTYTVTVSASGVESQVVTITQAAYVDPNQIHKVTVDAFNALTGTETATYELTGVVSEIYQAYNSSYDNISFYIEDETGKVLIFRMDCNDDASLASLKVGDVVTVQGKPTLYNEVIQMAEGGVCINHIAACDAPVISCVDNIVTITAETGATIYYTTDGSDPTESSEVYSTTIEVTETNSPMTVKAIAVADGKVASSVASKTCTYVDPNASETIIEKSVTFSESGYTNGEAIETVTLGDVTITFAKGSNSNSPKYYNTGNAIRTYGGNTFTFSGANIKEITFTFATGEGTNAITADSGTYANNTWIGDATSVMFTVGGTTGHRRIASVTVKYTN